MQASHIIEFQERGYTTLHQALDENEVYLLHEEADILMNYLMTEGYDLVRDFGCVLEPLHCGYVWDNAPDQTYRTNPSEYKKWRDSIDWDNKTMNASDLILNKYNTWASQLLSSQTIYLLNEQYIVKPPYTVHSQFDWHRDSDYYQDLEDRMEPTVACWTCLDNVAESNGTVELVDFKGQPYVFEATAGSILFMSNRLLHKSTGNATSKFRRAFMPQYSKQPMMKSNQCLAIQCDSVCLSYLHLSREKLPEFT